ncbi:MAG: DUF1549 domain-containing protein [Verrucomicrobiota bacterium]
MRGYQAKANPRLTQGFLGYGLGLVLLGFGLTAWGKSEVTPEQRAFFTQKVQPVLQRHCHKCHSHSADKIKGGLVVDSLSGLLTGGDTGSAVVPGHPEKSLLITAVSYKDEDLQMPPKGEKLSDGDIAVLTDWVKMGAPWPGQDGKPSKREKITDEDRQWWAFQPVKKPHPPAVKNTAWARNDIDRFVLQRLEKEGLKPAPEAPKAALIRRVYFDLWGLPPTPDDVAEFVADSSPNAYEKLIDRLLTSSHYGERWARHWLDLVRYADSDGYRIDDYRPHAWRYRDYVIKAFNEDKPYDRFIKEQLAGDELYPGDPEATTATGYLCHWIYEYNNRDVEGQWRTILTDLTDTTADVFLGMGMQCARCHDHKFDPILQKDYFALQAFFAPIMPHEEVTVATEKQRADHLVKMALWEEQTAELRREIEEIEVKYREKAARGAIEKFPEETQAMINKPVPERTPYEHQIAELAYRQVYYEYNRLERNLKGEDKEKVLALRRKLTEFDKIKPEPLPVVLAATDLGPKAPPILIPKKGKEPIEPAFLTVLGLPTPAIKPPPSVPNTTGRRAELARWLTQPDNPLTSRVIVNRIWQYHFGRGLAANASDFGKLGEQPSHPELLDWLASRFVADGWSFKKLHKLILTSATYRQAVMHPAPQAARVKDPENRLYWRGNTRRLEAEQIRDAMFAVTGELDFQAGGPGVPGTEPRRSIYMKYMRNARDPLLDVFDAPFWFNSASSRDVTTTPVQSLLLINSQFMLQRAKAFAARLEKEGSHDDVRVVQRAYELAFGRAPTPKETEAALKFLHDQPDRIDPERAGSAKAAFLYDKIPYRDGQAAIMSPEGPQSRFDVPDAAPLNTDEFTIEAFVLLRSVYDSSAVRTVAAKWAGDHSSPGWGFGITGKQSRRKPHTLVLQIIGQKMYGAFGEEAIFSDQHIQLNKPYYIAAAVKLAGEKPGSVTFYVKDLSNDDEPLLSATVEHKITGGFANNQPFTIGARGPKGSFFDGMIDDVRLSKAALGVDQLLFTNEGVNKHTVGYWQFEAKPDVFRDATGHGLDIKPAGKFAKAKVDVQHAALQDFCHVLLNANEFLYVE